jgi:hypothetical protein
MTRLDTDAHTAQAAARAAGADGDSDERELDQRRADALLALALATGSGSGGAGGAAVQVTLAATTLLGLDDAPGELAGYGPITADVARRIAGDATWRRLLTDPVTGALLDYGTTTYQPPQPLVDHVVARDRTCTGPGCRQPAHRCDLDHTVPYPQGSTSAHNLGCRCRHCHRLKHHTPWRVTQHRDGTNIWTSPTGHRYTRPPEPVLQSAVAGPDPPQPTDPDPHQPPGTPDPRAEIPPF